MMQDNVIQAKARGVGERAGTCVLHVVLRGVVVASAAVLVACVLCAPAFAVSAPVQPKLKRPVIVSKTSIQVNWAKVKNADGCTVYLINGKGKLKKVGSSPSQGRTSAVIKNLTYRQTYTFTVKAYRNTKSTKVFSACSMKGRSLKLAITSKYKGGYKLYYDSNGKLIRDVTGILKKRKSYYIKVNTQRCVVTAYARDKRRKTYCIPVKSWLCSPSNYTASGTWYARGKHRFWTLYYNSYSQWTMTIHNPILFHTVPYTRYGSKTSLNVAEYNKLGTAASHGCVRMPCEGVKWIYDNCPNGTKVTIYRSSNAGPFGKPKLEKLPKWHTWDPTDPTCTSLCTKNGCH